MLKILKVSMVRNFNGKKVISASKRIKDTACKFNQSKYGKILKQPRK